MAKRKNSIKPTLEEAQEMIGDKLNFAAAEAYKLLRTNLTFSLPNKSGCKIIGVTSALRGEGKSTTSINMAYTLAETGKNVLLLEADLRLPTIAKRLRLKSRPGVSNMLAGQCSGGQILQTSKQLETLSVITAGDIPPNPAELLGSEQMEIMLNALSKAYDYIVIDLPPVTAVSDALIVSKLVSGMVLVVRQNYGDKTAVAETMRQLKFTEVKILGFVMTGADTQEKNYGRYGHYKKYGQYGQDSGTKKAK